MIALVGLVRSVRLVVIPGASLSSGIAFAYFCIIDYFIFVSFHELALFNAARYLTIHLSMMANMMLLSGHLRLLLSNPAILDSRIFILRVRSRLLIN